MKLPKKLTKVEAIIFNMIVDNFLAKTDCDMYSVLSNPIDKMICYYLYDQEYSLEETCKLISKKRVFIWQRKKVIKKELENYYQDKHLII
jgi:hypothetical protein